MNFRITKIIELALLFTNQKFLTLENITASENKNDEMDKDTLLLVTEMNWLFLFAFIFIHLNFLLI